LYEKKEKIDVASATYYQFFEKYREESVYFMVRKMVDNENPWCYTPSNKSEYAKPLMRR